MWHRCLKNKRSLSCPWLQIESWLSGKNRGIEQFDVLTMQQAKNDAYKEALKLSHDIYNLPL